MESADFFKEFIQDPPTISILIYEQEVPEPGGRKSYFHNLLRWQTNGVLFAQSYEDLSRTGHESNLVKYPDVLAQHGNQYTRSQGGSYWEWKDTGNPDEMGNSLKRSVDFVKQVFAADVLNMGCHLVPIRSIQWVGDGFTVTNIENGRIVSGHLSRDSQGKAAVMDVESRLAGNPRIIDAAWEYMYYYDQTLSLPFLPSRIVASKREKNSKKTVSIFNLKRLETAIAPLAIDYFTAPEPVLVEDQVLTRVSVSNKFLVYEEDGRRFISPDLAASNESQAQLSKVYLLGALILISPVVFLCLSRRNVKYTSTKTH